MIYKPLISDVFNLTDIFHKKIQKYLNIII